MRRNPLYNFKNLQSTGISEVPLQSTIVITDAGDGKPKTIQLISKRDANGNLFNDATTIADLLNSPNAYIDPNEVAEIPSELEKIEDGLKFGWRLLGEDPEKHGPIGLHAIDLTGVTAIPGINPIYGALGNYSMSIGLNTSAQGAVSFAAGESTIAKGNYSMAIGRYNVGTNTNNILEIGVGEQGARKNAFEVDVYGKIKAPLLTVDSINAIGDKALVTKEYSDANLDSKFDKSGGIIYGSLEIRPGMENGTIVSPNLSVGNELTVQGITKLLSDLHLGLNSDMESIIEFKDPNVDLSVQPRLYWDNKFNSKGFYVREEGSTTPKKLWHEGNDGIGSGLDADKVHGISGEDMATKNYVDDRLAFELTSKYDKDGGDINGDARVLGLLTAENGAKLRGDVELSHIVSNLNIDGVLSVDDGLNVAANIISTGFIKTGYDSNGYSILEFTDVSGSGIRPKIFWNSAASDFQVDVPQGNNLELWHRGNFNPDDKMDASSGAIEDLTVVNYFESSNVARLNIVDSSFNTTGSITVGESVNINDELVVGLDFNGPSRIRFGDSGTGSTSPSIYWDSTSHSFKVDTASSVNHMLWHYGNFDPNTKLNTTGGTITGNLTLNGDVSSNGTIVFNGPVQYLNSVTSNMNITGDLTAGSVFGQILKVGTYSVNGSDVSYIKFNDTTANDQPGIYWDESADGGNGDFFIDTPQALHNRVWHSGNYDPSSGSGSSTYDNITVNNSFLSKGIAEFEKMPKVFYDDASLKSGIYFTGDMNNDPNNPDWQEPAVYWDQTTMNLVADDMTYTYHADGTRTQGSFRTGLTLWHSGNMDQRLFARRDGDTFTGDVSLSHPDASTNPSLEVEGTLNIGSELTAESNATFGSGSNGPYDFDVQSHNIKLGDSGNNSTIEVYAADFNFSNLPTSDPNNPGQLWMDAANGGILRVSQ